MKRKTQEYILETESFNIVHFLSIFIFILSAISLLSLIIVLILMLFLGLVFDIIVTKMFFYLALFILDTLILIFILIASNFKEMDFITTKTKKIKLKKIK